MQAKYLRWLLVIGFSALGACSSNEQASPEVILFDKGNFPTQLSKWGILIRRNNVLVLNQDVIPYDLNTPLFTDYAHKLRTIWIPPGKTIQYTDAKDLQLPVGSIVSKTFYYPRDGQVLVNKDDYSNDFTQGGLDLNTVQLIETRLLVHLEDGWHGLPYVWNSEQTDAVLEITGNVQQLNLRHQDKQIQFPYVVPDANQCQGCHVDDMNTKRMHLLGVKVRHVDKAYQGINAVSNQLDNWYQLGKLEQLPVSRKPNVDWQDLNQSVAERALSYLDINCGHCHNSVGPADTSGLYLRYESFHDGALNPVHLGICKPPVAAGQGTGGRKVGIEPGKADQSIFVYRMESLDLGAMMPELGRSLVHEEGVALIKDWINAMPGNCN